MAVTGFNVGTTLSSDDMNLAVDYLINKEVFEPELQNIKDNITNKGTGGRCDLAEVTAVERGQNINFVRCRRITGYISPDINRWNNGKRQELKDRTYNPI